AALDDKRQAQADDYYRWAVAAALRGELEKGNRRIEAWAETGRRLQLAIEAGWQHSEQLRRERAFVGVRPDPREAFKKACEKLGRRGAARAAGPRRRVWGSADEAAHLRASPLLRDRPGRPRRAGAPAGGRAGPLHAARGRGPAAAGGRLEPRGGP